MAAASKTLRPCRTPVTTAKITAAKTVPIMVAPVKPADAEAAADAVCCPAAAACRTVGAILTAALPMKGAMVRRMTLPVERLAPMLAPM